MSAAPKSPTPNLEQFAVSTPKSAPMPPAENGTRFIAGMIDGFFYLVGSKLCFAALASMTGNDPILVLTASLILPIAYYVLPIASGGQTLGKKLMKIQVIPVTPGEDVGIGQAFLREIVFKFVSALVFMLGYVSILRDEKRRAWHDKWAKTLVVSVKE